MFKAGDVVFSEAVTQKPSTIMTIFQLETYSERDGLWHNQGLFALRQFAEKYANNLRDDCYCRVVECPLLGYYGGPT